MSLALRISLIVVIVLILGMGIAGYSINRFFSDAQHNELEIRLNSRMTWLQSALSVEDDDNKIELDVKGFPGGMAEYWSVKTARGRILWSSLNPIPQKNIRHIRRTFRSFIEEKDNPETAPSDNGAPLQLTPGRDDSDSDDIEVERDSAQHFKNEGIVYYLAGPDQKITLILDVAISTESTQRMIAQFRNTIFLVIGAFLLILGVVLVLLIHIQLKPLAKIAAESTKITLDNLSYRIPYIGSTVECNRLRTTINEMIERLADGIERERKFSRAAAHDLRTPLAQLRIQAEVALRNPRTQSEYEKALSEMIEDVGHLEKLVFGLLLLTKHDNRLHIQKHSTSLRDLMKRVSDKYKVEIPELPEILVCGEEDLLFSAIQNVIENALQYAPSTMPIITWQIEEALAFISIMDSGPGIPEEYREHIFEPLVRLDEARTLLPDSGFGLGLAISRNNLRAFGGDIKCTQRRDDQSGSVFVLSFRIKSSD